MDKSRPSFAIAILDPAQNELDDIALLYLMLAGTESAERITDKILNAIERLSLFPLSGPYLPDADLRDLGNH